MQQTNQESVAVMLQSPKLETERTTEKKQLIRKENRPLTQEQVKAVIQSAKNFQEAVMLEIGFNAGCRVSEIISFNQDAIDWQQGKIKIWDEKKDIPRFITIPNQTLARLQQLINDLKPAAAPIFDYSEKTVERIIQRATLAGIGKERSWHTVRHTYVMVSKELGQDISVVIENTGDSPSTILRYYSKMSPGFMRKAVDAKPIYAQ